MVTKFILRGGKIQKRPTSIMARFEKSIESQKAPVHPSTGADYVPRDDGCADCKFCYFYACAWFAKALGTYTITDTIGGHSHENDTYRTGMSNTCNNDGLIMTLPRIHDSLTAMFADHAWQPLSGVTSSWSVKYEDSSIVLFMVAKKLTNDAHCRYIGYEPKASQFFADISVASLDLYNQAVSHGVSVIYEGGDGDIGVFDTDPLTPEWLFTIEPPTTIVAGTPFSISLIGIDGLGTHPVGAILDMHLKLLTNPTRIGVLSGVVDYYSVPWATDQVFSGLSIDKAGPGYILYAYMHGWTSDRTFEDYYDNKPIYSTQFTVVHASATKINFSNFSYVAETNQPFTLVVQVQDAFGNLVTNSTASISLSISTGSGGGSGSLIGTLTQNAIGGVSTFSNLIIDFPDFDYTITATSSGLTSGTSDIEIKCKYIIVVSPTDIVAGINFNPAPQVKVVDFHNVTIPGTTDGVEMYSDPTLSTFVDGAHLSIPTLGIAAWPAATLLTPGNYYITFASQQFHYRSINSPQALVHVT